MTGVQFASYIRKQTRTNSTTFPDADIVLFANPGKDDIASKITKTDEDYFGIWMVRNIVADKRNYAFENTQLNHMKRLEAKLDGTNWKKLVEYDVNTLGITTDEASIVSYFSGKRPGFDIFGNELFLLNDAAIINVTEGLKLWTIIYPSDIATATLSSTDDLSVPASSTEFAVPRQFHLLWADDVVIKWKNSQPKRVALTKNEIQWEQRLAEVLGEIKGMNKDRVIEATVPSDNGQDY